ncbi:DUF4440 domain-containing protein [Paracidovorax wautersii]|uniref:DUF4440 domain-containing protein n=1 Tax=Paracidovorax wautersii TaxID=1177982 RepID=A0ABU1IDU1_9BURK|nr:DUF4440 domain-containing protein [Paracidovorax wautersii]MDR6215395.1 hypothetical protein [Paracidovorax wautersii]
MTQDWNDLQATRAAWYAAYVRGDTDVLAQLQDPAFFVVSEAGTETRAQQLGGIAAAVRERRWFPAGSRTEDLERALHPVSDGVVEVRGTGRIVTPRGALPAVQFTERWHRTGAGWRALHLHYLPAAAT